MRRHHVHALATSTDNAMAAAARAISSGSSMWSACRRILEARNWYLNHLASALSAGLGWPGNAGLPPLRSGYSGPARGGTGGGQDGSCASRHALLQGALCALLLRVWLPRASPLARTFLRSQ